MATCLSICYFCLLTGKTILPPCWSHSQGCRPSKCPALLYEVVASLSYELVPLTAFTLIVHIYVVCGNHEPHCGLAGR